MTRKGLVFSLGAAFCFGVSTPFVKVAADNIPLFTFHAIVAFVAGLFLWVHHVRTNKGADWHLQKYWKEYILVGLVSSILPSILVYLGYVYSYGVNAAVLLRFEVFVVLLFGVFFFHEKISPRQMFGVLLGFFGIFVFVTKFQMQSFLIGDVYILLGAAAYAVFPLMVKRMHTDLSSTQLNLARMFALFPVALVGMILERPDMSVVLQYLPYHVFGTAVLVFIIGVSFYAGAVRYWEVWKVVFVAQFGSVVFGYGASAVMLGETLDAWQWTGTAIILLGIVLVLWQNTRRKTLA